MGLFDNIKGPQILKESNRAKEQLAAMEELLSKATQMKMVAALERDIAALKAGIFGEDTILFELKHSPMPLFVLHDLYLEHEGLGVQIDFLIITRKRTFVLECKNLYGNVTVKPSGEFVRTVGSRSEGIYSPITQSQRHLEVLKRMRTDDKGNILTKMLFENAFDTNYKSVVVLANPKTVLNARYASKAVREQLIRADGLIEHIRKSNAERDAVDHGEKQMIALAEYYLAKHSEPKVDYLERYRRLAEGIEVGTEVEVATRVEVANVKALPCSVEASKPQEMPQTTSPRCPICGSIMLKRKAGKGANVGKEFWGCSQFPKCRGVVGIR
jgi:ssDNA-binding Zn-finger/Zn-ribbon topoisomerase 1